MGVLRLKTVATSLDQAEWDNVAGDVLQFVSQAKGDIPHASSTTVIEALGIGATGEFLIVSGGLPIYSGVARPPLGSVGAPAYAFDGDLDTGMWSPSADALAWSAGGVEKARLTSGGMLLLGDTVNAKMTQGLTLNQGASDDEILALKSSDIAHGVTTRAETDTYALFAKGSGANGSLLIRGFADGGSQGVVVRGHAPDDDTTKTTGAVGYIRLEARKHRGPGDQAAGADANVLVVSNSGTVTHILDGEGDSHQDIGTAWTNFDDFDDLGILESLSMALAQPGGELKEVFRGFLEYNRPWLADHKIVTFNQDGHHFINWSRFHMVTAGALRQVGRRLINIEREMRALKGGV